MFIILPKHYPTKLNLSGRLTLHILLLYRIMLEILWENLL